jgi:ribulose-5-phosphate 4-epimerase/fuculose-1-phosphate aldolase
MHDEGVIKYQCSWDAVELPPHTAIADLITWRDRLHRVGLIGVYANGIGFGNLSQRLGPRQFMISGTQTGHLYTTQPHHYTIVDDWNIDDNTLHCIGPLQASSESLTHAALYEYAEGIQAVVHVHHLGLWQRYRQILPTTRAEVPYGTPAMAYEMWRLWREEDLATHKLLVMAGHAEGLLAFDTTLEAAATRLLHLLTTV